LLLAAAMFAQTSAPRDWTTWGYDSSRSGWNRGETTLNKENVSGLHLEWSAQLSTQPTPLVLSTLTAPLVAEGVRTARGRKDLLFVVGADDTVFALDAASGKLVWHRSFPNHLKPPRFATWLCGNSQNATPVIDKPKSILYLNTSDGKLRGLDLRNGEDRITPTDFVTPFARNWSLNLIDGVIYSPTARGCGDAMANLSAIDIGNPARPSVSRFYLSGGRPAGPWGRGGAVAGPQGVYVQTADGLADPAGGVFGESVIAFAPKELRVVDSFTPADWRYLNAHDFDLGAASPVVFPFEKRTLVAVAAKQAVVYLLDAKALGGRFGQHSKPLYQSEPLGNDELLLGGRGVWGAMTTYQDAQGNRFLYVPMWGPPAKKAAPFPMSYGQAPHGSVMAFRVVAAGDGVALKPAWISRDMQVPDPPVVANGVVYAIQTGEQTVQNPTRPGGDGTEERRTPPPTPGQQLNMLAMSGRGGAEAQAAALTSAKFRATPVSHLVLYAFDAETGKQLYSSEQIVSNWVHFSEPVVALGKVFVVTWDARVYAFGLKH
jgi:outer membrane protein assembly factor BamB